MGLYFRGGAIPILVIKPNEPIEPFYPSIRMKRILKARSGQDKQPPKPKEPRQHPRSQLAETKSPSSKSKDRNQPARTLETASQPSSNQPPKSHKLESTMPPEKPSHSPASNTPPSDGNLSENNSVTQPDKAQGTATADKSSLHPDATQENTSATSEKEQGPVSIAVNKVKDASEKLMVLLKVISEICGHDVESLRLSPKGDFNEDVKQMEKFLQGLLSCQQRKKGRLYKLTIWTEAIWKGTKPLLKNFLQLASGVS